MNKHAEYAAGVGVGLVKAAFEQPPLFLLLLSAFLPKKAATAIQVYVVLSTVDRLAARNNPPYGHVTID